MTPRDEQILALRRAPHTLAEIARILGVSRERVRQLVARAERREAARTSIDSLDALPTRIANALRNHGYTTKDEVRAAFLEGRFNRDDERISGVARKSVALIAEWAGIDPALWAPRDSSAEYLERAAHALRRAGYTVVPPRR